MRIVWGKCLSGVILAAFLAVLCAGPAAAVEQPKYQVDPTLSLIGDCTTITGVDPVPDPSCPYAAPPVGPTGRFVEPKGLAIDLYGNEYVLSLAAGDNTKGRVDIFDSEGRFITEAKVPDASTAAVDSKGNLYVFELDGDVVRYAPASGYDGEKGDIEYVSPPVLVAAGAFQGSVAVDTSPSHIDQVLIAREGTINRYKSAADAEPNGLIESSALPSLGAWSETMAIDSQRRRIYVSSCKSGNSQCGIKVLDADNPEIQLKEIDGSNMPAGKFGALSGQLPVAVDEVDGDVFIADPAVKRIYRFDESYEYLSEQDFKEMGPVAQIAVSNGIRSLAAEECKYPTDSPPALGDSCNRHYLFFPAFKTGERVAAFHPPDQTRPVIESVSLASIGETEAELEASIFPGGEESVYMFEITTQADWEANKFDNATIIFGGNIPAESLAAEVTSSAVGLKPGEIYRFRAVAENGLGPAEEEGQNEATFATYDDALISPSSCSNAALRLGRSALLPDCRAYELVSPAESNGRPPKGAGFIGSLFSTLQASPDGNAVSFKIEGGSIPGSSGIGSFEGDPYVSRRNSSGWITELAGANGEEATVSAPASNSPDQGYNFWTARVEGPLVIKGRSTEYLYYPDGHSELIGRGSEGSDPIAVGKLITEGAGHIVFQTVNVKPTEAVKLEPNAPPNGTEVVYDRTVDPATKAEQTHVVSLLPGEITPAGGQNANYQGASQDGEGIAFSIGNKLYLRVSNETTYEVGENVEFAGVSEGGDRIFYLQSGNLKALDTTTAIPEVIAFSSSGNVTPVNVSADGTRAYFVSPSVLGNLNPEGDSAQAGERNLYLSEGGQITFVATVTERDVEGEPPAGVEDGLGLWISALGTRQVAKDPSRTNPDGSVLLFQSRADITGYPESEAAQIYRFDSRAGELRCISCIPTRQPATGGASLESYTLASNSPQPFSAFGYVPNLTADGNRVFFESTEALVSTDTDRVKDVYEWEASGVGSCTRTAGCIYLISSGGSGRANFLYGHSTSGNDVFFTTGDSLTGWDSAGGAISIYDARVGGGFPEPEPEEVCIGDGCRPQVISAPSPPKTESSAQGHSGNVVAQRCPKGKHKVKRHGKVGCAKNKKKHKGKGKAIKRAGANRGAGK